MEKIILISCASKYGLLALDTYIEPLTGLKIGEQLAFLKQQLGGINEQ